MAGADSAEALGVLDRMTSILEAFDDDDRGLGLSELAVRAGLPKSTVSRLVATLVRQRYLERDGKRIHLGLRLFELGQLAEQPRELRIAALPVMADLRNRTRHNAHLAIRDGDDLVCLAAMRGQGSPPLAPRTGGRLTMDATALGDAMLGRSSTADGGRESSDGVRTIATAIRDSTGRVVAAIAVSGWADDFDVDRSAAAVRVAALAVSRRLAPAGRSAG